MQPLIMKIEEFMMYLDPLKQGISSTLWGQGYREPCFMWILRKEAKGDLGVDIGANLGYATLSLCKNMSKVIAIEPDRKSRKLLKKNIKINNFKNKVKIYNFAISDSMGESIIYFFRKNPNLNTLCKPKTLKSSKDFIRKEMIKTKTIDSLNVLPNFIKMDIEGYEIEAIEGGIETFKKSKNCKILIEVHPHYYTKKRSFAKILEKLFTIGFKVKYIVSAGTECPELFREKNYKPIKIMNDQEHRRGIFVNISEEDAINFCSFSHSQEYKSKNDKGVVINKQTKKIVRSILLVKTKL